MGSQPKCQIRRVEERHRVALFKLVLANRLLGSWTIDLSISSSVMRSYLIIDFEHITPQTNPITWLTHATKINVYKLKKIELV